MPVPLKMEKCRPLTPQIVSGVDSPIRNRLCNGLIEPRVIRAFLKTHIRGVFISTYFYKSAVRKVIKQETACRVTEGGGPRPWLTRCELSRTMNMSICVTGAAAGRNPPETQPEQ